MYQARRVFRSEFVAVRGLQYHVCHWGEPVPGVPPLVMVHGWMDVAASFQFMVDAFESPRHVIAPDWRGYGLTRNPPTDNYWFGDYLADLDVLIDHYSPGEPVDLLGHSMGGSVSMIYAGTRPERLRRLVNLEGFGGPGMRAAQAPGRYARWMDEMKALRRGDMAMKSYDSVDAVADRLMKTNRRLSRDKALWLAGHWAAPNAQGRWEILGDAAHKVVNMSSMSEDEVRAFYARITAPLLMIEAEDNSLDTWWGGRFSLDHFHERLKSVPDARVERIDDAGHMMHHDQPELLARLVERHLA